MPATAIRRPRLAPVAPLPDDLLTLAPEPVREASADLAAKLARLETAEAARRDAAGVIEQVVAEDHRAAVGAAEAQRPTPKPREPKAREKVTEAERAEAAMVEVVNGAQQRLLAVLREEREAIMAVASEELAELARQAAEDIDHLEAVLTRRGLLLRLCASLRDGDRLGGRAAEFQVNPPSHRRRHADPLAAEDRRLLDELRGRLELG